MNWYPIWPRWFHTPMQLYSHVYKYPPYAWMLMSMLISCKAWMEHFKEKKKEKWTSVSLWLHVILCPIALARNLPWILPPSLSFSTWSLPTFSHSLPVPLVTCLFWRGILSMWPSLCEKFLVSYSMPTLGPSTSPHQWESFHLERSFFACMQWQLYKMLHPVRLLWV